MSEEERPSRMPLLRTIGGLVVAVGCVAIAWVNREAGVQVWGVAIGLALVATTIIEPTMLADWLRPSRRKDDASS